MFTEAAGIQKNYTEELIHFRLFYRKESLFLLYNYLIPKKSSTNISPKYVNL